MMKKILFFTFVGLLMALTSSGQTASDTLQQANDSVRIGSHTEFSAVAQENSVTKAEGDSAYVKNDYASAIQIYEALLKEGEAAEVYYNLGNSYYKKQTTPTFAQASTLKQLINDFVQDTKKTSGTGITLSIVFARAISKLARISALPGCIKSARS